MKLKKQFVYILILLMAFCLMIGCLRNYGTIRVADGKWRNTIQNLVENWQDYDIYYAGLSYKSPSAIMFDPKKGGKRLISNKWVPVTEQPVVKTIVEWLDSYVTFPPTLFKILGPKGEFFGYMYTSVIQQVVVREIDPNTLFVEDIPLPPMDYGGGLRGEG